ncbi:hypothetical protein VIGAN_03119800 [Vigna angularis var. angularis]|uniref:Uncharacterized protein n=1 Tax=Vigna angularis var. angularis TaxID=157739 RepID=A0A0S3RLS7_PHAAN|nr:hypothetical protein VIGAN_03119800 [Vigna angularis var. angularis]
MSGGNLGRDVRRRCCLGSRRLGSLRRCSTEKGENFPRVKRKGERVGGGSGGARSPVTPWTERGSVTVAGRLNGG